MLRNQRKLEIIKHLIVPDFQTSFKSIIIIV